MMLELDARLGLEGMLRQTGHVPGVLVQGMTMPAGEPVD